MCGGTVGVTALTALHTGLSPRVRGNPQSPLYMHAVDRSIPACAGEPSVTVSVITHIWVYPRVCGGTAARDLRRSAAKGLSPRVRGNRPKSPH